MVRSPYERLEQLLTGEPGERMREIEQSMRSGGEAETTTLLTNNNSRLASIGSLLTRLDREMRRAATILGTRPDAAPPYFLGGPGFRPRPISSTEGGLLVVDARPGSLNLLIEAYGTVVTLLTSQPVLALTTALTLGQQSCAMRVWIRDRIISRANDSRIAIDDMERVRGDLNRPGRRPPSFELDIRRSADEQVSVENRDAALGLVRGATPILPPRSDIAHLAMGQLMASGSKVTVLRTYADGTQDLILVESDLWHGHVRKLIGSQPIGSYEQDSTLQLSPSHCVRWTLRRRWRSIADHMARFSRFAVSFSFG